MKTITLPDELNLDSSLSINIYNYESVNEISTIPPNNSAYHTGMMDINNRADLLRQNIMDATPYMYVSIANVFSSIIWIAVIIGIFTALKRKRTQLKESDTIGV